MKKEVLDCGRPRVAIRAQLIMHEAFERVVSPVHACRHPEVVLAHDDTCVRIRGTLTHGAARSRCPRDGDFVTWFG